MSGRVLGPASSSRLLRLALPVLMALPGLATPGLATPDPGAPSRAEEGDVTLRAPDGPVLLGEHFDLVVSGAFEGAATLDLGELPSALRAGDARLEATPDGVRLVQTLRAVREGALRLDGLALVEGGVRLPLPPVDVVVTLDLPPGRVPRVADALPPVAVPAPPADPAPFALLLFAGLAVLGAWVILAGRRVAPPPAPPRAPDLVATEALAALRLRLPSGEEQVPPFVDDVSAVLRSYVEDRFGARAPESTTEEFLAELASRHDALSGHAGPLERFLHACDLVKFARHRPPPAGVVPLLDTAEEFVESTRS